MVRFQKIRFSERLKKKQSQKPIAKGFGLIPIAGKKNIRQ